MRPDLRRLAAAAAFAALLSLPASSARAQSINIALGVTGTPPSSSYAAAGLPGVWNDIPLGGIGQRLQLVGLDGNPLPADIRQVGATGVLESNDPATSGDDEALLDSMVTSMCVPLDACYWIDHLQNGPYVVTLYALTPNDPALLSSVRVDDATPNATLVGGAWGGQHIEGLSYQRFVVDVVDGEIGLHSGVPSSGEQSGLNGIQIQPATAVGAGSLDGSPFGSVGVHLTAFPNPASGAQTIEVMWNDARVFGAPAGVGGTLPLEIVDVLGRVVFSQRVGADASGRTRITWDGRANSAPSSPAAPGVYFVRLAVPGAASPALKLVRTP